MIISDYICSDPGPQVMGCLLSRDDQKNSSQDEVGHLILTDAKRKKDSEKYLVNTEIVHDPWGAVEKIDAEDDDIAEVHGDKRENVSIIDLRAAHSAIQNVHNTKTNGKNSESQTEPADGVDFDWDLTDKTDIETQVVTKDGDEARPVFAFQTAPPSRVGSSHPEPADAIVQTDQRIVFKDNHQQRTDNVVTFDLDELEKLSIKNGWSQTHWDVEDKEVQVCFRYFFFSFAL